MTERNLEFRMISKVATDPCNVRSVKAVPGSPGSSERAFLLRTRYLDRKTYVPTNTLTEVLKTEL